MFFNLFYMIFMTMNSKSAFIKVGGMNKQVQKIMEGFANSIDVLSRQYPNQIVELEIEFPGTTRASIPMHRLNNKNRSRKIPRQLIRANDDSNAVSNSTSNTTHSSTTRTTTTTTASTLTSVFPSTVSSSVAQTLTTMPEIDYPHYPDSTINPSKAFSGHQNKWVPIYFDDLKKAFDDFAKSLGAHKGCNDIPDKNQATTHYSSRPTKPLGIQDIVQLIGKGVHVEYDVPQPPEEDTDWLQIKVPINDNAHGNKRG